MASNPFQRFGSKVWWGSDQQSHYPLGVVNRIGNGSPNSHKSQDSGFSDSEVSGPPKTKWNKKYLQNDLVGRVDKTMDTKLQEKNSVDDGTRTGLLKDGDKTPKKNLTSNIVEKTTEKEDFMEKMKATESKIHKKSYAKRSALFQTLMEGTHQNEIVKRQEFESSSEFENDEQIFEQDDGRGEPLQHTFCSQSFNPSLPSKSCSFGYVDVKEISKNEVPDSSDSESVGKEENNIVEDSSTDGSLSHEDALDLSSQEGTSHLHQTQGKDKFFAKLLEQQFGTDEDSTDSEETKSAQALLEKLSILPCTSTPNPTSRILSQLEENPDQRYDIFETLDDSTYSDILSLRFWVQELQDLCEPECTTTLQCKSIANQLAAQVLRSAQAIIQQIGDIKRRANALHELFSEYSMDIRKGGIANVMLIIKTLTPKVSDFAMAYAAQVRKHKSGPLTGDPEDKVNEILGYSQILNARRPIHLYKETDIVHGEMEFNALRKMFFKIERAILIREIKALIALLHEEIPDLAVRSVLYALTTVTGQFSDIPEIIAEIEGPKALLLMATDLRGSTIRSMALRVLSMISSLSSVVKQLEQGGVIDILDAILKDNTRPEPELSEAVTLLIQITSPWVFIGNLEEVIRNKIDSLVSSLTEFLDKTRCCNNLLLSAAALVHLSQMDVNVMDSLIKHMTVQKLLDAVRRRGPKASVFLKEQTTTLIANLSEHEEFRSHLAEINGALALLYFMQVYPYDNYDQAKRSAAQTVQQKSAVALFRLCSDAYVSQQIVDLGGVHRLIQLCKDGRERQFSDTVLVACLSALRKIVANCGEEVMDQYDLAELIQPRLFESFVIYSSQNESYV